MQEAVGSHLRQQSQGETPQDHQRFQRPGFNHWRPLLTKVYNLILEAERGGAGQGRDERTFE